VLLEPLSFIRPEDHELYQKTVRSRVQSNAEWAKQSASNKSRDGDASDISGVYDVDLIDLVGVNVGFRGRNPYSDHAGSSTRYFKMYERDYAYDFVAKAGYNGLLWLLVLAGERDVRRPMGRLSPGEHLAAWLQAKKMGVLEEDDKVPSPALNAAAVEMGVAEWSDIGEQEVPDGDDGTQLIPDALPTEKYAEALRRFEDVYGEPHGRRVPATVSEFERDGLETDDSAVEFAERFLKKTSDTSEQLEEEYAYPRIPVDMVWKAAKYWAEEINDVPLKSVTAGGKKDIRTTLDTSKSNILYAGQKQQCYKRVKFNDDGYRLYKLMPDDYSVDE